MEQNVKQLKRMTEFEMEEVDKREDPPKEDQDGNKKNYRSMRSKSPYFSYFKGVIDEERKKQTESNQSNPLYCPWFIDLLLKDYLPFVPLWTSMMLRVKEPKDEPRLTNCDVEQWIGQVKARIWQKKSRMRPLWAIRKLHISVKGRVRHHLLQARSKRFKKGNKTDGVSDTDDDLFISRSGIKPKYFKDSTRKTRSTRRKRKFEKDITLEEDVWSRTPRRKKPKYLTPMTKDTRTGKDKPIDTQVYHGVESMVAYILPTHAQ